MASRRSLAGASSKPFVRVIGLVVISALVYACSQAPGPTATPTASVEAATGTPVTTASLAPTIGQRASPSGSGNAGGSVGGAGQVPAFAHVWVMVLENASFATLADGSSDPYLHGLIARYGLAANYFAVSHPSQPNYLALFSGSTQGISDDALHNISAPNLTDQLRARGKTWRVYEQDYPGSCYAGTVASGQGEGFGVAGSYARKHDPAISFDDIRTNPSRCADITSLAGFDPAAADFELIVPNSCNDMHSCPLSTADAFLSTIVPHIVSSPSFTNSVLFLTTDEGTGQNQVATLVVSPLVRPGFTSTTRHDHYSLLRTIEDAWNLGCLGNSCTANSMSEFFGP